MPRTDLRIKVSKLLSPRAGVFTLMQTIMESVIITNNPVNIVDMAGEWHPDMAGAPEPVVAEVLVPDRDVVLAQDRVGAGLSSPDRDVVLVRQKAGDADLARVRVVEPHQEADTLLMKIKTVSVIAMKGV